MAREQSPVDFVSIFNQRFAEERALPDSAAREVALCCADIQVDMIKKRVPAVVFVASRQSGFYHRDAIRGLWIEPTNTLEIGTYPHWQLEAKAKSFFSNNGLRFGKVASSSVFEDGEAKRHLVLDATASLYAERDLKQNRAESEEFWVGLARDYQLSSVLSDSGTRNWNTGEQLRFADSDLIGKLREEEYLLKFAQERQMTNFQWLRFRSLALGARDAKVPIVYTNLADEIVAQDK